MTSDGKFFVHLYAKQKTRSDMCEWPIRLRLFLSSRAQRSKAHTISEQDTKEWLLRQTRLDWYWVANTKSVAPVR
jgi:hypothetical protein